MTLHRCRDRFFICHARMCYVSCDERIAGNEFEPKVFVLGGIMAMSGCQTAAPTDDAETVRTDRVSARRVVAYKTTERPGTIIVEPSNYTLYLVQPEGKAIAYPVGVGKSGHSFNGRATIARKG
ncbi:hypothetical protein HED55_27255 [Ochrobactrum haematophilum]|uniref:L,D-transpeptidase n=1 Tax=Brucella haematophila TaxID=419474 RepID=A0ABX1DR99_9HYPH|nr:hypothetical protein [Brucella haematophila]